MGPVCSTEHFSSFERSSLKKTKGLECFSVSLLSRFDLRLEAFMLLPDVLTPVRLRPLGPLGKEVQLPLAYILTVLQVLSHIDDMSFFISTHMPNQAPTFSAL